MTAFLVVAAGERFYERRFSHDAVRGERKMSWSYAVLHPLHILIYLATGAEYFWLHREVNWPVMAIGLILFVTSLALRLTAIRTLGRFWSLHLEIRPNHELVRDGIYRYVRHPAYLAIMLEVVAIPLVVNSYYTLLLSLGLYLPVLLWRWRCEEREMIGKFGGQYIRYCKEVPAFVPWRRPDRIRHKNDPIATL